MSRSQTQSESEAKLAQAFGETVVEARRRRAHGVVDADDVAQDACVRVLDTTATKLRDPVRYLFRISRNLVIDGRRSRIRETALSESLTVIDGRSCDPLDPERILAGEAVSGARARGD